MIDLVALAWSLARRWIARRWRRALDETRAELPALYHPGPLVPLDRIRRGVRVGQDRWRHA